jgi:hypothetical protein
VVVVVVENRVTPRKAMTAVTRHGRRMEVLVGYRKAQAMEPEAAVARSHRFHDQESDLPTLLPAPVVVAGAWVFSRATHPLA